MSKQSLASEKVQHGLKDILIEQAGLDETLQARAVAQGTGHGDPRPA